MSDGKTQETKASRNRSPEHPTCDLEAAVARTKTFYTQEHFNWAPKSVTMGHWGFGAKSSSGLRTLAALMHFGLLEGKGAGAGRQFRLSDDGRTIVLREPGTSERDSVIRRAALKPAIYAKVWGEWGANGKLPSEDSMRYDLEVKWAFNPKAITSFIDDFRSTLEFARILGGDIFEGKSEGDLAPDEGEEQPSLRSQDDWEGGRMPDVGFAQETVRPFDLPILLDAGTATLRVPTPMSADDFDVLMEAIQFNLNLYKSKLTRESSSHRREPDEGA